MEGKSAIVYYSLTGNTEVVAKEIQRQTGFDIQRIEEKKERKKGKIMGAAFEALIGFKPGLEDMDFGLEGHDNVFLGGQVWAGKVSSPLNAYMGRADLKGKKVWIFLTKGDDKVPQKVIDSIKAKIEKQGGKVMGSISLTSRWDPVKQIVLTREDVEKPVREWLNSIGN